MLWNTINKCRLGIVLLLPLLCSYPSFSFAKKVEPEKTSEVVVQGKQPNHNSLSANHEQTDKVNINSAGEEELAQKLTGIGKQKARAIVEYRQKYGAFNSIENLLEVQGIGPAFLEKNKDKLVL